MNARTLSNSVRGTQPVAMSRAQGRMSSPPVVVVGAAGPAAMRLEPEDDFFAAWNVGSRHRPSFLH